MSEHEPLTRASTLAQIDAEYDNNASYAEGTPQAELATGIDLIQGEKAEE